MRIYFYSWQSACVDQRRQREFAHTKSRREREWLQAETLVVFPEFLTLNNASTSGRPHTTANSHWPLSAPTQLFFRISIGWFTPTHCMPHACLRYPIYDATAHCVLGQDNLHLVTLYFSGCFSTQWSAVCSIDPALKLGPDVFFKTPVTVIRWPLLRRKILLHIASSFFGGGG